MAIGGLERECWLKKIQTKVMMVGVPVCLRGLQPRETPWEKSHLVIWPDRPYWFWAPNNVFGLWMLIFTFLNLKVDFFLRLVKIPIDGYITRSYWFWAPNSVFGLWEPIFVFLTPKSTYFLHLYTISDWLMGHMPYFIFEPPSA
jgi:hypothetical protein